MSDYLVLLINELIASIPFHSIPARALFNSLQSVHLSYQPMEDHVVAIIGDWVPPSPSASPSPRTFFSSLLGAGGGGDNVTATATSTAGGGGDYTSVGLFLGSQHQHQHQQLVSDDYPDGKQAAVNSTNTISHHHFNELNSFFEDDHKGTSRSRSRSVSVSGGLVERIAARTGFNAPRLNTESIRSSELSLTPDVSSPYLTIPPGLSPTTLLDSPVFLSNSLAQPSPTTGKFLFIPNNSTKSSKLISEAADRIKHNHFDHINASSFAFKHAADSGAASKITPATNSQPFSGIELSIQSENSLQCQTLDPAKLPCHSSNGLHLQPDFPRSATEKDTRANVNGSDSRDFDAVGGDGECSPPLDEKQDEERDQGGIGDSMIGAGAPAEDGYNWRKYGQKQVKGSEYPRSYYKCTHPNCQVKKKVERSHQGHITEIIYKGAHNHPKPPPNRRSAIGSSNPFGDSQSDIPEQAGLQSGADSDLIWPSTQNGTASGAPDWRNDNLEVTSTAPVAPEFCHQSSGLQAQNRTFIESGDAVDASSTFSNDEDEDDRGTHGSVSLGYDGEGDESESKRRKVEAYATEMSGATRAIREPRVVVQTTSEVDILDDGYRWRKYGQKVVKGNPNPRSYYKCTNAGCTVRKHVERASHDLKSVITTYEGKHNHDVPAARNSSHVNSTASNALPHQTAVQTHVHRPEPSQIHPSMTRFERPASVGSFSLPGRQQLGPSHGFSFGMNQPGLANLTMAGLGPSQGKLPILPVNQYFGQQHQMNDMVFMMPKGEPKVEPTSESGLNLSNSSSVYQQIMSRLPLGPQM